MSVSRSGSTGRAPRPARGRFSSLSKAPAPPPVGFLDPEGFVAIEAPDYDRAVSTGGVGWKILPGHGRTLGAVTPFPVAAASIVAPGGASPRLEYDVYLGRRGELPVRLVLSPALNYQPTRGLRCAISLDDQAPQVIPVGTDADTAEWNTAVRDSVRVVTAAVANDRIGSHVFKVWVVDPGVVLQRIEIDTGGLKSSFLGPPESPRGRRAVAAVSNPSGSASVTVEAESGALGGQMPAYTATVPGYVSVSTDGAGSAPSASARVARYQVTFPAAGSYRLFARVRVGSGGASDDSFFLGNGFGAKNPATASDWRTLNNFSGSGFAGLTEVVLNSGGTAGTGVWKWIDAGSLAGLSVFTVPAGALTQTLDLGGRENGLDIDKLVFGSAANTFTVENLSQSGAGAAPAPAVRVLEAEASSYGAELVLSSGTPTYLTVSTAGATVPGSAARVMRFTVNFAAAATYRLFARVRVGPGGANDDSLFLGGGFGAKDPALASDWRILNNFAGSGYSAAADVVSGAGGTAGTGVWKWLDLSALSGLVFSVPADALGRTLDLGGREDGLDIDKLVFAPSGNVYTVADLDAGTLGSTRSVSPVFTVALGEPRQTLDGFGASSAWTAAALSDTQADQFFSPSTGIGLSLLRVRIAPEGTTAETVTAQKAAARGARVWATPWSPPAAWKSNNDVSNGGTLLPEFQDDWAARLAGFVATMQAAGVPLLALSAQNEPNYTATWESCRWTPVELAAFVRDQLGPALAARGLSTRVLAPESINSDALAGYGSALLGDPAARPYVSHLATHSYGRVPVAYPAAAEAGLSYWQTEFTDDVLATDPSIDSGLRVAAAIHDFLAVAEGNAWHYWWLMPNGAGSFGSSGLVEGGVPAKRAWTLGNWARFVRPGYRRVQAYGSDGAALVTAFVSPASRRLVVVAVNTDYSDRLVPLALDGGAVPSLAPWQTSASRSLDALAAFTPAADGSFSLPLPARSVTTYVSEALNRPPAALALSGASVAENLPAGTVVGRLSATDPDTGETFRYALAAGDGDADNAAFTVVGDELRTVARLDFEAGATRVVRIAVADMAGAVFERSFVITVANDPFEYADWSAALPPASRAPEADAGGDGVPNLLAHALGFAAGVAVARERLPRLFAAGSALSFGFSLPSPAPGDVSYRIERSGDLATWTEVAAKTGDSPWTGSSPVEVLPETAGVVQARVSAEPGSGRAFYRLRVLLSAGP